MSEVDGVAPKHPHRRDPILWAVISVGMALGGGGTWGVISKTDDRIRKAEVVAEFSLRDERIKHNRELYEMLRAIVQRIDETHPPPELVKTQEDHEERIRRLERGK